ncbi:mucin-5AC-like isoform X2 [Haliotis rubra]|uniref:mucin-5AC-like isoform X2 n=1 Tax=Haliotis rubra TaxID=36100 RepID=UPI001EE60AA2|nr:mucin-5AC-like isoform X2 [Haliotis rubra]
MVSMVSLRFLVQPIVVLLTLKGVTGQWGGGEIMGSPLMDPALAGPGLIEGGGFGMDLGAGMGGGMGARGGGGGPPPPAAGGMGMARGFPLMSLDQLAEYNEMPYLQRPLAARIAEVQWRSQMPSMLAVDPLQTGSPPTVTEKPKRYRYPRLGNEPPGPRGPDKHAWTKLKATLDKTLSVFPTQERTDLKPIASRFTQEPAHHTVSKTLHPAPGFQGRVPLVPQQNNTLNTHRTHNTQRSHNTHHAPHSHFRHSLSGSHGTNVKPYIGPTRQSMPPSIPYTPSSSQPVSASASGALISQPSTGVKNAGAVFESKTPVVATSFQQRGVFQPSRTPSGPVIYQAPRNILLKQSAAFTSRGRVQKNRPVVSSNFARGTQSPAVHGVSQVLHKPAAGFNQVYVQPNTGIYDLQGIKATDVGYTQFGPAKSAMILTKNPNPQIESMRQAVQNGERFGTVLKSNKTAGVASTTSPSTAAPQTHPRPGHPPTPLDALTQAAEGPSIFNLNSVSLNGARIRSGIPNAIPDPYSSVTSSPYLDAGSLYGVRQEPHLTTQSWSYTSPGTYYTLPQTLYPDYLTHTPYYQGYYELNSVPNQVAAGAVGSDYIRGGLVVQQSHNSVYQIADTARKITTLPTPTTTSYDPSTQASTTPPSTASTSTTPSSTTQLPTTPTSTSQTTSTQPPVATSEKLMTETPLVSMSPSSKMVEATTVTPLPTLQTSSLSQPYGRQLKHMDPRSQQLNPGRPPLYRDRQINIRPEYLLQRDRYRAVWNVRPSDSMGPRPTHVKPNPNPRYPLRQTTTEGTNLMTSTAVESSSSAASTSSRTSTETTILPTTPQPTTGEPAPEPTAEHTTVTIPSVNSSASTTAESSGSPNMVEGPPDTGTLPSHSFTPAIHENASSPVTVVSSSYKEAFHQSHQLFDAQIQNMDRLQLLAQGNVDSQTRTSAIVNNNTQPNNQGLEARPVTTETSTYTVTTSTPVLVSTTSVAALTASASSPVPPTTTLTPTTVSITSQSTTSQPTTPHVNVLDTSKLTTSHYTDYISNSGRNPTLIGQSLVLAQNRFNPGTQGHVNVRGRIELSDQMQFSGTGESLHGHLTLKQVGGSTGVTVKPLSIQQPTVPPRTSHLSLPRRSSFVNSALTMRHNTPVLRTSVNPNMSMLSATPAPKFPLNTRTGRMQYQYPQRTVQPLRSFQTNKQTMGSSQRFGSQTVVPRSHFLQRYPSRIHSHRVTPQPTFRRQNFTKPTFSHIPLHTTLHTSLHKGLRTSHNFINHSRMTRGRGLKQGMPAALGGQGNPRHSSKVTTRPVPGTHRAAAGRKGVPYATASSVHPTHPRKSVEVRSVVPKTNLIDGKPRATQRHPNIKLGRPGHPSTTHHHLKRPASSSQSPHPQRRPHLRPPSASNTTASTDNPRGQIAALNTGISKLVSAILPRPTHAGHPSTSPRGVSQRRHHHRRTHHSGRPHQQPPSRNALGSVLPKPAPTSTIQRPLLYSTLGSFSAAAKTHKSLRVGNPINKIKLTSANPRPQHPASGKLQLRQVKMGQPAPRAIQPTG